MMENENSARFKYQQIYRDLRDCIARGDCGAGDQLPTEKELSDQYGVSRPTVIRALNALREANLIVRRAGSGTFVTSDPASSKKPRLFGLVVPRLGKGEIFEPICAQIAAHAEQHDFSLLWSASDDRNVQTERTLQSVAERYINAGVDGVFFAPLELAPGFDVVSNRIAGLFEAASIPMVLIDADYLPFPERSSSDLVGIDNFRAGYQVTEYFTGRGIRRVDFVSRPFSAHTIHLRLHGYRSALADAAITRNDDWIHFGAPEDESFLQRIMDSGAEAVVSANDETAAALMVELDKHGVSVPEQLRIIAFDDIRYAQHLRVPLTTYHQPVLDIGNTAIEMMLWRIANPEAVARNCAVDGFIVQRQSCGFANTGP